MQHTTNEPLSLSRRSFLVGGLGVTALAAAAPHASAARLGLGRARRDEHVLVVVQLSGGNDGLNMVVPFEQDAYFRLRPSISLAPGGLHRLGGGVGLHTRMAGCGELFEEGQLAVVQGVGYPDPDRSHFRSMQVWHTADPGTAYGAGTMRPEAGWLGRLAAQAAAEGSGMPALFLGTGDLPLSLKTRAGFTPTVRDARGFQLEQPTSGFGAARGRLLDASEAGRTAAQGSGREHNLATLHAAARSTYDAAARMQDLIAGGGRSAYPNHPLAERLALCAQLIAGGFGTRLFGLELGGFDTHARQAPSQAALLAELSESLAAFQRDLAAKGVAKRVVTLVFSEFGRRVEENASKGTDHGAAGPALVLGEPVRGGLFGATPDLTHLEAGDLPFGIDFRSIYTALETDWLGLEASTTVPGLAGLI